MKEKSNENFGDDHLRPNRRTALAMGGVALASIACAGAVRWTTAPRANVFVARNQKYSENLAKTIREGFLACGIHTAMFCNKRVLLKPNLVEPSRQIPYMTTHPAVIVAAAEVFADWGAHVTVGEAPGHVRDTEMVLAESGVDVALKEAGFSFADLNYEQVEWRSNQGGFSPLQGIFLPQSVAEADFVVSLPKMKTHHWVGVTCSMKNLYGVLPGSKYGWPKNVLHHNGIPQTVVDINATVPRTLTIVDGIDCMEGDGPILGSLKRMGLLVIGENLPAVDATVSRIMGLAPERVSYLQIAADRLGPIDNRRIQQQGDRWQTARDPFAILDKPHLRGLRASRSGPLVS